MPLLKSFEGVDYALGRLEYAESGPGAPAEEAPQGRFITDRYARELQQETIGSASANDADRNLLITSLLEKTVERAGRGAEGSFCCEAETGSFHAQCTASPGDCHLVLHQWNVDGMQI